MFSSYGGVSSRSKSITDIFRASSDPDDVPHPPDVNKYTHFRKNTNPMTMINRRRRMIAAPPAPPQRSNSSFTVNLDPDASAMKRVRSYLTDDNDDVLHEPDPSSVTVLPTQLTQSPGSKNFVKKLVATLERRQREQQLGIGARVEVAANNELVHKKNVRNTVPGTRIQEINRDQRYVSRHPAIQLLEDLHERDENNDEDWYDAADLGPQFWEDDEETHPSPTTTSLPIHIIERKSDNNNNSSKSTTVKRTIKNMFSSILNWKNSKSLPKGSREYYAARESLGEEMRAFRRDTMPRLMEHATIKGKFKRNRTELASADDDQREFSQLIGSPKENSLIVATSAEEPSIATIHPVYGSSNSHQRRSWHTQDLDVDENQEVVYGSIKVEPPTPPPRVSSQSWLPHLLPPSTASKDESDFPAVIDENKYQEIVYGSTNKVRRPPTPPPRASQLLNPQMPPTTAIRDLQRIASLYRDSYSQVQLRRAPASANNNKQRNSIVYDVPRSNRRVESVEDTTSAVLVEHERVPGYINRVTPSEYANVSGIIGAHDDDKRLRCTAFTTF